MKVLQINCVYKRGSTGKIMYDLHNCLLEKGYESLVVYGRGEETNDVGVYKSSTEFEGKIHSVLSRLFGVDFGYSPIATAKLLRIIKKEKPDVVHLQCLNGHFVNVYRLLNFLKKNKIKTVLSLHAEIMHTAGCQHAMACEKWKTECRNCTEIKGRFSKYFRDDAKHCFHLMKNAFEGFENLVIVGVSDWITQRAKQAPVFGKAQFATIINGIETDVFMPCDTSSVRKRLGILSDKKVILHVTPNIHDKQKGIHHIIELARRMPSYQFVVVGGTPAVEDLPQNILCIPLTYDQKALAEYYSMADCLAITSDRETCPTVCLEATACGCNVVGFDTGGIRETVPKGMGEVVKSFDLDAFEAALRKWADVTPSKDQVGQLHLDLSRSVMTDNYLTIYKQLCK